MKGEFVRSDVLFPSASEVLKDKCVAIFGLGGVGGVVAEALARMGVGSFVLIDNDVVEKSNINRQIIATASSIGIKKTQVLKARLTDINKDAKIAVCDCFYTGGQDAFCGADYIVDCIDTVTSKVALIKAATNAGVPIISSMGTGNKKDITLLKTGDIKDTSVCPLARAMRKTLKEEGIDSLKVVWSIEKPTSDVVSCERGRHSPASAIFVPWAAGLMLAKEVIEDLTNSK